MNRAKVVIYQVSSIDGRLALSPEHRMTQDERWDEFMTSKEVLNSIKSIHKPGAFMEGSGSLLPDDFTPEPLEEFDGDESELYKDFIPESITGDPDFKGWYIFVDSRGRVRNWIKEGSVFGKDWVGYHTMVLVSKDTPAEYLAYLRDNEIPYMVSGEVKVNLKKAFKKMKKELGIDTLVSVAGGRLNGALLREKLIDEINIEFFPAVIGGEKTPSLFDCSDLKEEQWPLKLDMESFKILSNNNIWVRYKVKEHEQTDMN